MNKSLINASWIIGCKVVQSLLGLVVSLLSARYLGPSSYGEIQYASSLITFVTPLVTLGFNSILVYEIVTEPKKEGEILGSAILTCGCTSVFSIIGITWFAFISNKDNMQTALICILFSVSLLFTALEIIQYWYHAKLISKYTGIVSLISYSIVSGYRIFLLATGKSVYWFAIAHALDIMCISVSLLIIYKILGGKKLTFSGARVKRMFSKSKYYIVSDIMVTFMTQTDRIMLKQMSNSESIGWYSAAALCAGVASFVFSAIADSFRPIIFSKYKQDKKQFELEIKRLYSVFLYLSIAQGIGMTILSDVMIYFMYGADYQPASLTVKILVWHSAFSYLGVVRNIWILAEGQQKYIWKINLIGAIANVVLNYILIPVLGHNGAALASMLTQFIANVVSGFFIKDIRYNNVLMIKAMNPKTLFDMVKSTKINKN